MPALLPGAYLDGPVLAAGSPAAAAWLPWLLSGALVLAVVATVWFWHLARRGDDLAIKMAEFRKALAEDIAKVREDLIRTLGDTSGDLRERIVERLATGFDTVQKRINEELARGRAEQLDRLDRTIEALEKRFENLQKATEQKLAEIRGEVEKKLTETIKRNEESFSRVADKLTQLHEAAGQMVTLSRNVGELKTILESPKARGAFGELTLEQMLAEIFGTHTGLFATQYELDGRERVDAVIFVEPDNQRIVCIDAKFPLANAQPLLDGNLSEQDARDCERKFARDVLNRAREIADKYIRPPLTLDFAFMFVPAESVYYLLLKDQKLHEELLRMHVVPTSPNALYAYLRALAYAFRGRKLQQQARQLQQLIEDVARDFERFAKDFSQLGRHIDNAKSKYDQTLRDVQRFNERIGGIRRIEVESAGTDAPVLPAENNE